ncbi:hypothetical protein V7094_15505 [Priestia megaterium]|uniref:hypothetical protein n=1 Tax=Priestia megaterium TaxID=1404 RepID=UPI0030009CEC
MIVGYNFFGFEEGAIFDTPICTEMIDELRLNEGTYDEVYVDLDTSVSDVPSKPSSWSIQTIMDAKFTGDLDAGSLGADGFKVTRVQLYRTVYGTESWELVTEFDYDEAYNMYNFTDRYVQNGVTYQYAIVPVANEVMGERLVSDTVDVSYHGIFLTDRKENKRLEFDITLGDISHNTNSSVNEPLNGQFPIVVFGNSNYRSGNLSVLPISDATKNLYGAGIDKMQEQINRTSWLDFLNNCKAKVLRIDSGVLMLVVTMNAKETHMDGDNLRDLATLSFDYTEIGKLTHEMMQNNDLLATTDRGKFTFNDYGEVTSA